MKKLTKAMKVYFAFWIVYIPCALGFTLLLEMGLQAFLAAIGIGALLLFAFLAVGLVIAIIQRKKEDTIQQAHTPDETLAGFRTLFTEVKP